MGAIHRNLEFQLEGMDRLEEYFDEVCSLFPHPPLPQDTGPGGCELCLQYHDDSPEDSYGLGILFEDQEQDPTGTVDEDSVGPTVLTNGLEVLKPGENRAVRETTWRIVKDVAVREAVRKTTLKMVEDTAVSEISLMVVRDRAVRMTVPSLHPILLILEQFVC